jgi:hypothetical protein
MDQNILVRREQRLPSCRKQIQKLLYKTRGHTPALADKRILPADNFWPDICLTARGESPSAWSKCFVEDAAIFNFWKVNQAIYE